MNNSVLCMVLDYHFNHTLLTNQCEFFCPLIQESPTLTVVLLNISFQGIISGVISSLMLRLTRDPMLNASNVELYNI